MVKANNWINYKLVMNDAKRGIIIFQFHVSVRDHNLVKPWLNPTSVGCWIYCHLWGWRNLCITTKPVWGEERRFLHVVVPVLRCDAISPCSVLVTCEWCNGDAGLPSPDISVVAAGGRRYHPVCPGCASQQTRSSQRRFAKFSQCREKAPTTIWVLSLFTAPISTFTIIKNLLWHYSERAIK